MKKTNTRRLAGFTLDQTILVVAVIAVLATIIISSVAWNVLNRANATKLNAHLQQISDSIGNYYQDGDGTEINAWPSKASQLNRYLAGYTPSTTDNLYTPFGTASNKSELVIVGGGNERGYSLTTNGSSASICASGDMDCYILIRITNIQAQEAEQANESIDGPAETTANAQGRLRWTAGTGTDRVTMEYFAVKRF